MNDIYKLRDWIDESKLFLPFLCKIKHPGIIPIVKKYRNDISWFQLSKNPEAIELIEEEMKHLFSPIIRSALSMNPSAIHFFKDQFEDASNYSNCFTKIINKYICRRINWDYFSLNPAAIHLLEKNPDKINWRLLSKNPEAIHLLEKNTDKIHWRELSENPAAVHILEKNPDKINWWYLSGNPAAIHLIEKNPDKIDWWYLSENPEAIHLLEANPHKIDWYFLSRNPAIFEYDYAKMKNNKKDLHEELIAMVFHPRRVMRYLNMGYDIDTL